VRVRASSVSPVDAFLAGGVLKGMVEHEFPVVLGRDYAGVVEQAEVLDRNGDVAAQVRERYPDGVDALAAARSAPSPPPRTWTDWPGC
jgi:hypothetical protein